MHVPSPSEVLSRWFGDADQDVTVWHKCRSPLIPRRTVDGSWTSADGQTWRRRWDGRWEYRQDPETWDDFERRQW